MAYTKSSIGSTKQVFPSKNMTFVIWVERNPEGELNMLA